MAGWPFVVRVAVVGMAMSVLVTACGDDAPPFRTPGAKPALPDAGLGGDGGSGSPNGLPDGSSSEGSPDGAKPCVEDSECQPEVCVRGACVAPTCTDGRADGTETDVDCGGDCGPCADGAGCADSKDCASLVCEGGHCAAPTCRDGVKNGSESDQDCGGNCEPCADGKTCTASSHCTSGVCANGSCQAPTCEDRVKNGAEVDVDCGGSCPACGNGSMCREHRDCATGVCIGSICVPPGCVDGLKNADETDTDCGGEACPRCGPGGACLAVRDCASGVCQTGKCAAPACDDTVPNGNETDTDCGGNCKPCDDGKNCGVPADCRSGVCNGTCQMPSCTDGVKNGTEAHVDCGSNCPACAPGSPCSASADCSSGICSNGQCTTPTCSDGVKNADETDRDCGASCPRCANGLSCTVDGDCSSAFCRNGTCTQPRCDDSLKNGAESDVDCGGGTCPGCPRARTCAANTDCASGHCYSSRCAAGTVRVEAGRVFETGVGELSIFDGVQLVPGGPEELVVGNGGDGDLSVLSGSDERTGFTTLNRYSRTVPIFPRIVRDVDGDGSVDVLMQKGEIVYGNLFLTSWDLARLDATALTSLDTWTDTMESYDLADLDQDGSVDVLFSGAQLYKDRLQAKFGIGGGRFGPVEAPLMLTEANGFPPYPWLATVQAVQAGGDTKPDLVMVVGNGAHETFLVKGDGLGGFTLPPQTIPDVVAAGDVDGDGDTDFVCSERDPLQSYAELTLRINDGGGTLRAPQIIPVRAPTFDPEPLPTVVIRDLDRNGTKEIITNDKTLDVWRYTGTGVTRLKTVDIAYGTRSNAFRFGDFDGNGLDDIAVAFRGREIGQYYIGANVSVFYQRRPLEFVTHQTVPRVLPSVAWVAVGDFDGNGSEDVLSTYAVQDTSVEVKGPTISYFAGETLLRQDNLVLLPDGNAPARYAFTGDFNGDGRLDFVTDTYSSTLVVLQNASGGFGVSQTLPYSIRTVPIHLNGDTREDIVMAQTRRVDVYGADASGTLTAGPTLSLGADDFIEQVLVADVDGDGRDDVIATGYRSVFNGHYFEDFWMHTSKTWIFSNSGTGSLSLTRTIDHNPHEFSGYRYDEAGAFNAGVGDFDGDGTRDLAINYGELHYVALHFASGAGGPAAVLNCDVLVNPNGIAVHDWNGDGRDDLAVNAFTSSAITLLLSTGRTTCPTFHGHYRMGFRANNIELLRRSSSEPPAVVGSGQLGVQILPFRLVP